MTISRRAALRGATAAAATFLVQPRLSASETGRFATPVKIPPLLEGTSGREGKVFDLGIAPGKSEFLPGIATSTIGINGAYLGPTIRCRAGERVTLRVRNALAERTALHWHGLHIPARFDGDHTRS
jgi:bilirubin oxidase